ncbi:MAG: hypothetical protein F6K22_29860, partial [Okeania sp. SIO2F4]|uniref:hypothetical protein n=1 Tax=Okeania sp. SIO2F4 TaxID=2607790 RepID=UPI00142BB141
YQLTELDPALVSRFNLYEFVPTVEDLLLWAAGQDIDSRVLTLCHFEKRILSKFIDRKQEFVANIYPNGIRTVKT